MVRRVTKSQLLRVASCLFSIMFRCVRDISMKTMPLLILISFSNRNVASILTDVAGCGC